MNIKLNNNYLFENFEDKEYYNKVSELLLKLNNLIPSNVFEKEIKNNSTMDRHQRETLYVQILSTCADELEKLFKQINLDKYIDEINKYYFFYKTKYDEENKVFYAHDYDINGMKINIITSPLTIDQSKYFIFKDYIIGSLVDSFQKKMRKKPHVKEYEGYLSFAHLTYKDIKRKYNETTINQHEDDIFKLHEDFIYPFLNFCGNIIELSSYDDEIIHIITLLYTQSFTPRPLCEMLENMEKIMLFILERNPNEWKMSTNLYSYIKYYAKKYDMFKEIFLKIHKDYFWKDYIGKNSYLFFCTIIVPIFSEYHYIYDSNLLKLIQNLYTKDKYDIIAIYDFIENRLLSNKEDEKTIKREYPHFPYLNISKKEADRIVDKD